MQAIDYGKCPGCGKPVLDEGASIRGIYWHFDCREKQTAGSVSSGNEENRFSLRENPRKKFVCLHEQCNFETNNWGLVDNTHQDSAIAHQDWMPTGHRVADRGFSPRLYPDTGESGQTYDKEMEA